jgi:RimJ/RimL family protein N-acetyltransferase
MDWRPVEHVSEVTERLAAFVTDMADGICVGWVIRKPDETTHKRLSVRSVSGTCDPENLASARMLQKCGFRYVGCREDSLLRPNLSDEPRGSARFEIVLAD